MTGFETGPPGRTAGMTPGGVLPPGLTPRTAGANLLPCKRAVGRAGDTWLAVSTRSGPTMTVGPNQTARTTWHGRLVEVTL